MFATAGLLSLRRSGQLLTKIDPRLFERTIARHLRKESILLAVVKQSEVDLGEELTIDDVVMAGCIFLDDVLFKGTILLVERRCPTLTCKKSNY